MSPHIIALAAYGGGIALAYTYINVVYIIKRNRGDEVMTGVNANEAMIFWSLLWPVTFPLHFSHSLWALITTGKWDSD